MRGIVRRPGVVDSLLQTLSPELLFRVDTMNVTFGIIDRVLEDTVYALSPTRRLSGVFKSDMFGWGVVAFLERLPFTDAANKSVPDRIRAVENIVRARKQTERAGKFSGSVLSPQRAEADPVMFERFADAFHDVMLTDTASHATKTGSGSPRRIWTLWIVRWATMCGSPWSTSAAEPCLSGMLSMLSGAAIFSSHRFIRNSSATG